ncbi:MAG: N-acyl amino acid synthase of PEP-CTERM/exosortase system [Alteromonadaceae bacterium]|jgi:N-acyl amino acid synthase of PEP-CTERM/exosortase system
MSWSKKLLDTPVIGGVAKKIVSMKVNSDAMSIAEHFTKFLQPEFASNHELTEEVYRIRHNVYCDELAFLDKHEDGREHDEFDPQSLFALIKHKPTDVYTSCVRIVKSTQASELLPLEKLCMNSITNMELHPKNFARSEIAEISRLAVKAEFRRRKVDKYKGSAQGVISETTYSETELRCFPFIAIGLYMAGATLAIDTGVKHVYVMMEPRLARSMKFVGIKFIQLGDAIDYHGLRAPYYINPLIFLENLSPGFKSLYLSIREDLNNQINRCKK